MSASGENLLAAVRECVERMGVSVTTDDVIARRKLEQAIETATRKLRCECCDGLDWDEED